MGQGLSDFILICGISAGLAVLALWLSGLVPSFPGTNQPYQAEPESGTLLFKNGVLQHATDAAVAAFNLHPGLDDWEDLRTALRERFPDFPDAAECGSRGARTFQATDGAQPQAVQMRWRKNLCWVSYLPVVPLLGTQPDAHGDHLAQSNICAPHPAWAVDETDRVIWSNPAFQRLAKEMDPTHPDCPENPFRRLDPNAEDLQISMSNPAQTRAAWFDLRQHQTGNITYYHATDITAQRGAEAARRRFVQTLSKTFAHLPIGMVIFDKDHQLSLFNPALVDLTGLSPAFLSRRPGIMSFFDELREKRRMPEPKNYAKWRAEIAQLVHADEDHQFQETWALESGQTYRVEGRPHPDGATAFMIEDISAEVSLTRNFRAELELEQAVFDSFDEAIAVFSSAAVLTFSNSAYRDMWAQNPDAAFADVTLSDAMAVWQAHSAPDGPWKEIQEFLSGARKLRRLDVTLPQRDGGILLCRMRTVKGGARLVRFEQRGPARPLSSSPLSRSEAT